jgi:SAM-dependent methyltransferase
VPLLSEPIDLVFCRGVLQHTEDPRQSLQRLFDYARPGGLVVFDVYRKTGNEWRNFKYFFRRILKGRIPLERFHAFLDRHGERLYRAHHAWVRFIGRFPRLRRILATTPFFYAHDWERQYPHLAPAHRLEAFKSELIDAFYCAYDQPMTKEEVVEALAEIGQRPYSLDEHRNQFRCRATGDRHPIRARITKQGVIAC